MVGVGFYVYKKETDPIEKRGSASEEFETNEAPQPKPPPKKRNPRPWPTYGYDDGYYSYNDPYYDRPSRYYYDPGPAYYYGPRVYAQPSIGFSFGYHRWRGH